MKFERCFDSEVECFEILSEDYTKIVFLQTDRYLELHSSSGRHYRLRIPKPGRDLKYHKANCDLMIVGTSPDIYRLNLERGQFMQPYETTCSILNTIDVNPYHNLICVGSEEGTVEAFDPREKRKVATLDIAMQLKDIKNFPSVTSLKFKNELQMGIGTASGHVFIYDIRSRHPTTVKDHLNQLPIKRIEFGNENFVYSLDSAMLKVWESNSGKQKLFIESSSNFNDFCTIPKSGLFFFAQEEQKMQTNYVPSLGNAPKWCSFLDKLTEEIEAESVQNIYDDYKFVTRQELQELNLEDLEGTDLLKAYMHGFFVNMKLYLKAKSNTREPYKPAKKTVDRVEPEKRLEIREDLPKVNQKMALRMLESKEERQKSKKKDQSDAIVDDRFKAMFENSDFQIDEQTEEYRRSFKPTGESWASARKNKLGKRAKSETPENSDESDAEKEKVVKRQQPKKSEIKAEKLPEKFKLTSEPGTKTQTKKSLAKRLEAEQKNSFEITHIGGNRQMVFTSNEKSNESIMKARKEKQKHHEERKKVIRSAKFKFK